MPPAKRLTLRAQFLHGQARKSLALGVQARSHSSLQTAKTFTPGPKIAPQTLINIDLTQPDTQRQDRLQKIGTVIA